MAGFGLTLAAAGAEDRLAPLVSRFQPDGPAAVLTHHVAYRFLAFELKHVANSRMVVAAGQWTDKAGGAPRPAALLNLWMDTPSNGRTGTTGRVVVRNRLAAVVTMPSLDVLLYAKEADHYFNPLFGHERRVHEICLYDFEGGDLAYQRRDLLTGTTHTNLADAAVIVEQSRQIKTLMTLFLDAYTGRRPLTVWKDDVSIWMNVDGKGVPLGLAMHRERSPLRSPCERTDTLALQIGPPRVPRVRSNSFASWMISFSDYAQRSGDPTLAQLACEALTDSMVPLVVDYDLPVGRIRAALTSVQATDLLAKRPEPPADGEAALAEGPRIPIDPRAHRVY